MKYFKNIEFTFTKDEYGFDCLYTDFVVDPDSYMQYFINYLKPGEKVFIKVDTEKILTTTCRAIIRTIIEEYCERKCIEFSPKSIDEDNLIYSIEYENDEDWSKEENIRCIYRNSDGNISEGLFSLGEIVKLIKENDIRTIITL